MNTEQVSVSEVTEETVSPGIRTFLVDEHWTSMRGDRKYDWWISIPSNNNSLNFICIIAMHESIDVELYIKWLHVTLYLYI